MQQIVGWAAVIGPLPTVSYTLLTVKQAPSSSEEPRLGPTAYNGPSHGYTGDYRGSSEDVTRSSDVRRGSVAEQTRKGIWLWAKDGRCSWFINLVVRDLHADKNVIVDDVEEPDVVKTHTVARRYERPANVLRFVLKLVGSFTETAMGRI
ncbi:hypothetical protein FIBSPDRAFT_903753 [Athelia psychrophila]|uniref:Uncharacterized protein n=1 Tax=Athelia psychrophila TaxID=1759441 RepID=A0A167VKX6_9AGAM|nr:hypothetical protein FIBSPDRAFT_903753 [Fibularhizoctonia sp. CBS 109695]